uniref:Uncharacterized protein n=1 Tax=Arundo donax TaxID=35708 RepID=A0A0A8Y777_ARUDO
MYLHCTPLIFGPHPHYLIDSYVNSICLTTREVINASYHGLLL